jgi:hypothetical protein
MGDLSIAHFLSKEMDYFFAFLAGAFLAGAFLAATFLAGAFFLATTFFAVAFFAVAMVIPSFKGCSVIGFDKVEIPYGLASLPVHR